MVTICQKCGGKGFSVAIIYCDKCQVYGIHRYCLDVFPETFDEYVTWYCHDCEAIPSHSVSDALSTGRGVSGDTKVPLTPCKKVKKKKPIKILSKRLKKKHNKGLSKTSKSEVQDIIESKDEIEALVGEDTPPLQLIEVHCAEAQEGTTLRCQEELDLEDRVNSSRRAESVVNKHITITDTPNFVDHYYVDARPIINPVWRGSLSTGNKIFDTVEVAAHLSSLACSKVYEEAKLLPELLSADLFHRRDVWPKGFEKWGPSDHSIALYFFSGSKRNENTFDIVLNKLISQDLAMRVVLENAELLVFASTILPSYYWRFQDKLYLWGVFRGKQASHLRDHAKALTRCTRSPISPLSNSGTL